MTRIGENGEKRDKRPMTTKRWNGKGKMCKNDNDDGDNDDGNDTSLTDGRTDGRTDSWAVDHCIPIKSKRAEG